MIGTKKIVALIPARGGSKGVPRKNIKLLAGKPLISYTIEAARASMYVDRVIVSTDDLEIARVASLSGAEVPFIRPAELATDSAGMGGVIKHALTHIREVMGFNFDIFCTLYPCCPFRTGTDIDKAVEILDARPEVEVVVSVTEARPHPMWCLKQDSGGFLETYHKGQTEWPRRQELPAVFRLTGALGVQRVNLPVDKHIIDIKKAAYVMDQISALDIDEPIDFMLAETIIDRGIFNPVKENQRLVKVP